MSKMQAQSILLINPIMQDLQSHTDFRDHMRKFFASEVEVPYRIISGAHLEETGKDNDKFD